MVETPTLSTCLPLPMHLTLIAPFALHPKGTTRWRVLPLARALAAQGHRVRVLIAPYDWPAHSSQRWQVDGVELVHLPVKWHSGAMEQLRLGYALAEAAQAQQSDIVHVFKPKGPGGIAARLLLSRGLPVVVDTDDYEAGWNAVAGYSWGQRLFFRWQEQDVLRRARAVTAASRWLCGFTASLGQRRVTYLPNGVGIARSQTHLASSASAALDRSGFGTAAGQPTRPAARHVLLYTRFVEHCPAAVWAVWRRVLAGEPKARLLVAGQGSRGEEAELLRLARAAGHGDSIQCLGWLPAAARPGLFAAVDAALLPVRDTPLNRAKSPLRLLELLAGGVPVITQRVGEYGTWVGHEISGLVAAPGDSAALAAYVLRLLREPELGRRLAAAALARVAANHAWPRLAEEVVRDAYGVGQSATAAILNAG